METIQLSLDDTQEGSNQASLVTVAVTGEQELAMEAFFQINNWQLIKGIEASPFWQVCCWIRHFHTLIFTDVKSALEY